MLFRRTVSLSPDEAAGALRRGELQLVDVREPGVLAWRRAGVPLTERDGGAA